MDCFDIIKNIVVILLSLYSLGMSIYSGYTANNNRPRDDSNGLFIVSYVICIIYCIIYLGIFFHILTSLITNNYKNDDKKSNEFASLSIPTLLNIYWLVIYFNYKVSYKYDEFALVKTIEFFTLFGILIIFILCIFPFIIVYKSKNTHKNRDENTITSV